MKYLFESITNEKNWTRKVNIQINEIICLKRTIKKLNMEKS